MYKRLRCPKKEVKRILVFEKGMVVGLKEKSGKKKERVSQWERQWA